MYMFLPFLLAHFALLIFWMSLSFTFYKTFWALWMLMMMAVNGVRSARVSAAPSLNRSMVRRRLAGPVAA